MRLRYSHEHKQATVCFAQVISEARLRFRCPGNRLPQSRRTDEMSRVETAWLTITSNLSRNFRSRLHPAASSLVTSTTQDMHLWHESPGRFTNSVRVLLRRQFHRLKCLISVTVRLDHPVLSWLWLSIKITQVDNSVARKTNVASAWIRAEGSRARLVSPRVI